MYVRWKPQREGAGWWVDGNGLWMAWRDGRMMIGRALGQDEAKRRAKAALHLLPYLS